MTLATMGKPTFQSPAYAPGLRTPYSPMFPSLWHGAVGAWCPSLGPTGGTLYDFSGYGNNGTLTNMDPGTDWVVSGGGGYALDFDGINDYVNCGNADSLSVGGSFSISAFVFPLSIGANKQRIVDTSDGVSARSGAYSLKCGTISPFTDVSAFVAVSATEYETRSNTGLLQVDQWQHVVTVYDITTKKMRIWHNGVEVSYALQRTAGGSGVPDNLPAPLMLGFLNLTGAIKLYGHQRLDDVRIYDRALSPEEIFILSGFGGHEALGRGIAYRTRDDVNFIKAAEAAGGGFPFQLYYQQRRQRGYSELEPTEYEE